MAGSDIAAAIMGALDGGLRGYGQVQQRKRQQALDEEEQRRRLVDEQQRARAMALQEGAAVRAADRELRTDYEQVVGKMPAGTAFQPNTVTDLRALGMGEMIDEAGTQVNTPDVLGQQDLGLPAPIAPMTGAPSRRETATEQATRLKTQGDRQQAGAQDMAARGAINKAPLHLRDWMSTNYAATKKLPATQPEDYTSPEEKAARSFEDWSKKNAIEFGQRSTLQARGEAAADRRSAASRADGSAKPSNGMEKKALSFFNRARQADQDLQSLEADVTGMGLGSQTYMKYAPNAMQTQTGQAYQQAQRAFTEARLRKDSGAAIAESEYKNDQMTYFAQPGDSKETLAQKARARANVLSSLAFESGAALREYYGDEADTLVGGYRGTAARPGTAAPGQGAAPPRSPSASSASPNRKTVMAGDQPIVLELQGGKWIRVE